MTLLGDFLADILKREEVQQAAASLLIEFFQPKPGLEGAMPIVITIEPEEVKEENPLKKADGSS